MRIAEKQEDNMLLEWEFALRMHAEAKMKVLPLLVYNSDTTKFSAFNTAVFPDAFHGHPLSKKTVSVRATMTTLFQTQGVDMPRDKNFVKFVPDILTAFGPIRC